MTDPWTLSKRIAVRDLIDKCARDAADSIGATHVVLVAFFEDGKYIHMQDGGEPPMPFSDVYKHLVEVHDAAEARPDGYVQ
jgi:hypothetical protein